MTSQTGQQIIAIHILPNSNQTMKFGQLIEYNMRNTFLEKSYSFMHTCMRGEGGGVE